MEEWLTKDMCFGPKECGYFSPISLAFIRIILAISSSMFLSSSIYLADSVLESAYKNVRTLSESADIFKSMISTI
jgi:hypothetical protein